MPKSTEPARLSDLDALASAFREDVDIVLRAFEEQRLPLVVVETKRSTERQNWLFTRGLTRDAGDESPFVWGLALRLALDPEAIHWKCVHAYPSSPEDTGIAWNGRECFVVRPHVVEVIARAGRIVVGLGLTWGGRNAAPWASPRPLDPFGRDPWHVSATRWQRVADRFR